MNNQKIRVVFDMDFNGKTGEIKATVSFELPEHPETPCPESVKPLVMEEIRFLSGAACAAAKQLFTDEQNQRDFKAE